ncbi:MAG TPA: AsmA family protein [Rhodocyclaceae bacterium]|nr:AsmA family protein [Rhodocyclaceae bacterium]
MMDSKAVYTKTTKGLREVTGKAKILRRDLRNVLKEIDGKRTASELLLKLGGVSEDELQAALLDLINGDYIREFASATVYPLPEEKKLAAKLEGESFGFANGGEAQESPNDEAWSLDFTNDEGESLDFTNDAGVSLDFTAKAGPASKTGSANEPRSQGDAASAQLAKQAADAFAKAEAKIKAKIRAEARARQQAEEAAQREAEEKARLEAEAIGRREAEERARLEVEEKARLEAEEKARREAEEKLKREAEAKARLEAEEKARREAEEKARREAEERARLEAEERARLEAEERARLEAEEKARLEAEAMARREAEEKARLEAEERARLEVEEKARLEAEERAKREAEERLRLETEEKARQQAEAARREAEEKLRLEAEERARLEAEAMARREAEEKARLEAEEKLKREAEAKARLEAEEKARLEAEEKLKREAEAKARREAEEKLRLEAEAMARREAEEKARLEAEETAKREAEEKARFEAEEKAKREAEEKARLEAEAKARLEAEERARLEAEERARLEAEAIARREAEERARREAEEKARLEAEEKLKREAEEKAKLEAEERVRIEAEETAKRDAEAKARREAEERAGREAEERARLEAEWEEEARRELGRNLNLTAELERVDPLATASVRMRDRLPDNLGKRIATGLLILLVVGLGLIHVLPFDEQRLRLEQTATAQLQQPVTIKALHWSLLPRPHWRLDGITVGSAGQIKVAQLDAFAALGSLFGGSEFPKVEIDTAVLSEEGLGWLLFGKPHQRSLKLARINARNIKLESKDIAMPAFDAKIDVGGDGKWRTAHLAAAGQSMDLRPMDGSVRIDFTAASYRMPFGSALEFKDFEVKGVASPGELAATDFSGYLYGGLLRGNGRLKWGSSWSLDGELNAEQVDAARLAPGLVRGGKLEGRALYSFRAEDAGRLFAAGHLDGDFIVRKGVLLGVDFGKLLKGERGSGNSPFSEIAGKFAVDEGRTELRQLRLAAGMMSASGELRVDPGNKLQGRIRADLKSPVLQRSASLALSGTLDEPRFNRQ